MKKISRAFPKPARVMAFILACIMAGMTICYRNYEKQISPAMMQYPDGDLNTGYLTSGEYRVKLAEMYEQLCILGMCELANMDENMNYVGNKYLMSDFLYYLDYNQYKYKKTDDGIVLVSDMFDYYVSYTKPAAVPDETPSEDESVSDDETTIEETYEAADETGEETTVFVTNISADSIHRSMTESERLLLLRDRFSNYLLRSNDVVSSDMTSSGSMIYYQYQTVQNGKVTDYLTENYPSNFLPLGGWYHDNYGRYVYNFGNDNPIIFYDKPENTEEGRRAREHQFEIRMPDYSYDIDGYYDGYFGEDGSFYAYVPPEAMPDYEADAGDTAALTVFIAPKEDMLEKYIGEYNIAMHYYKSTRTTAAITGAVTFMLLIYLLAAAIVMGLCKETGSVIANKIPLELYAVAFISLYVYILDDFWYSSWHFYEVSLNGTVTDQLGRWLYILVGGLLVGGEILMGSHIVSSIFAGQLKQRLASPKLIKKLLAKYRTTGLYKGRQQLSVGRKLRDRTLTLLVSLGATLFLMFLVVGSSFWDFEWLFFISLVVSVLIFIVNTVRDLLLSRELSKLDRRIAALKHNEPFTEKVSEGSEIYSNIQTLDNISEAVKEAVEDQLKSERMKIELVANVSHDLKTPLTSIISYIDLLKKTDLSDEARDYVQILDKKSQKLKSIVADVFSLAKATSGIDVNMEELDFVTLFNQSLADADDKIKKSGKIVKVMVNEQSAPIMGDGSKLYRVFQNIIDNALKYSMDGSRIFLDVTRSGDNIVFTAKNTSSYPIDFTADEITERFVRGDKSRTDGGSGLGLSIAKSFTEACGGRFDICLDGDMFKAIATMPLRKDKIAEDKDTI